MKRNFSRGVFGALALLCLLVPSPSQAADLIWDSDSAPPLGGDGAWDTANPRWWDNAASSYRLWNNSLFDNAVFQNTPGQVTVGTDVVAQKLIFNADGFALNGPGTITLGGAAPTIDVANTLHTATINAAIAGTNLAKTGMGTLVLGGVNTYTGTTSISGGVLSFSAGYQLGDGSGTNGVSISNNAVLRYTGQEITLGSTRDLAVGAGGATIDVRGGDLLWSGSISSGSGDALTKTGAGLLTLGTANNSLTGSVVIRQGTLAISDFAALGANDGSASFLTLDGGALRYTGAAATSARQFTIGAGGGTIENNGTGAIDLNASGTIAFSGAGPRTFTLSGTNTSTSTFRMTIADQDSATGRTKLVKRGAGAWLLAAGSGSINNTYSGGTEIHAGNLYVDNADSSTSNTYAPTNTPLGSGGIALLGGTLNIRVQGDSTTTRQTLLLGNDVNVYNMATLRADRVGSVAQNKALRLPSLTMNGTSYLIINQSNNQRFQFGDLASPTATALTLNGNSGIEANADVYVLGKVVQSGGNYGLYKSGYGTLGLVGEGNDYRGGTIVNYGYLSVGRMRADGTADYLSNPNARLPDGPVGVLPTGALHAISYDPAQTIDVYSHRIGLGGIQVEQQQLPTGLRFSGGSGVLGIAVPSTAAGGGFTQALNLARMGDGTWSLGYWNFPVSLASSATYAPTTLGAGKDNTYRLGGLGGQFWIAGTDVITGDASAEFGRPLFAGSEVRYQNGEVVFKNRQNYTGASTIYKSQKLYVQNRWNTASVDIFGQLALQNSGSMTRLDNTTAISANVYTGSLIIDQGSAANTNRWGDNLPIKLWAGGLEYMNVDTGGTLSETVGDVTFEGGSYLRVARDTAASATLVTNKLLRSDRATAALRHNTGRLGISEMLRIGDATNRGLFASGGAYHTGAMTSPFVYSETDAAFVDYDTTADSFKALPFSATTLGTAAAPRLDTDIIDVSSAVALDYSPDIQALRTSANITGGAARTITLRSAGLISRTSDVTIAANLRFGAGADQEGFIWQLNDKALDIGTFAAQSVATDANITTTGGLTKSGTAASRLRINAALTGLTGGVVVNSGYMEVRNAGTSSANSILGTNDITLNGYNTQLLLRSNFGSSATPQTWNNTVIAGSNIPLVTINVDRADTASNDRVHQLSGVNLLGATGVQGQQLVVSGGSGHDLYLNALSLAGNVTMSVPSSGTDLVVNGPITGTAAGSAPVIAKTGAYLMAWRNTSTATPNSFAPGTTFLMQDGTWEIRGESTGTSTGPVNSTVLGNSSQNKIVLERGTLQLRANDISQTFGPGTGLTNGGYAMDVRGDATLDVGRYAGSTNDRYFGLGGITLSPDIWLSAQSTSGQSHRLLINDSINISNRGNLNVSLPTYVTNGFKGAGGTLSLFGGGPVFVNYNGAAIGGSASTVDGGIEVRGGGVNLIGYTAGSLGSGNITLLPGGGVVAKTAAVLGASQQINVISSSSAALASVGIGYVADPTTLNLSVDPARAPIGVVALANGTSSTADYNIALDMGSLFGGRWYLGGVGWNDGRYVADSLGIGLDNTYRLGGGGGALVLNRNEKVGSSGAVAAADRGDYNQAGKADNLLHDIGAAPAKVVVGATIGGWANHGSSSRVIIAGNNSYTGGTIINRGSSVGLVSPVYENTTGLGTGAVDLLGTLYLYSQGSLVNAGGYDSNALNLHPGSQLYLENSGTTGGFAVASASYDRLSDTGTLNLNGARLFMQGRTDQITTETVGTLNYSRGATIVADRVGTSANARAILTISELTRDTGTAADPVRSTLMIWGNDGQLGATGAVSTERVIVNSGAPMPSNGIVAPYIMGYNGGGTFLTYDSSTDASGAVVGFKPAAYSSTDLLTASADDVVDTADSGTAINLTNDRTVYGLRVRQPINVSANNTITIRSGGLVTAGGGDRTVNANIRFADGNTYKEGYILTQARSMYLRGRIAADHLVKFGDNDLIIQSENPGYSGGWTVNAGGLRSDTFTGLGTGAITLNGGNVGSGAGTLPYLNFYIAANTPDEQAISNSRIKVYDSGRLYVSFGDQDDRKLRLPEIDLDPMNLAAPVALQVDNGRSRSVITSGAIHLNGDAVFRVTNNYGYGRMSSFDPDTIIATGRTLNKMERGILTLPTALASDYVGGRIIVSNGPVRILGEGSFGSPTTQFEVQSTGVLELSAPIAAANPARVTQMYGSYERWIIENARGSGDFSLGSGIGLQLGTSLFPAAPRNITMAADSGLEAFQYTDEAILTSNRIVGPNVTLALNAGAGTVTIGQNSYRLANDAVSGRVSELLDAGNPVSGTTRGGQLWVQGNITGTGNLLKVGRDIVTLSGQSSFNGNVQVDDGILRGGATGALPSTAILSTRFTGAFDLYGNDHTVANIGYADSATVPTGMAIGSAGEITNSGYDFKTLTAGNASDFTYNGQIIRNVSLAKIGTGRLTLAGANTNFGDTQVAEGTLRTGAVQTLSSQSRLVMGSTSSAGVLEVQHDQTVSGLYSQTNSVTLTNSIQIATGKVLTINGDLTLGNSDPSNTTTRLAVSGASGQLVVNAARVQLGVSNATSSVNGGSSAILDLSQLGRFDATVGTFRVGDIGDSGGSGTSNSSLVLAGGENNIIADLLQVTGTRSTGNNVLTLGAGVNRLYADTVQVGLANNGTGGAERANGQLIFDAANTTGTLIVRGRNGTAAADLSVVAGNAGTGASSTGLVDFRGHNSDLLLDTLDLGNRTSGNATTQTGGGTANMYFDTGTLVAAAVNIGHKTGTASANGILSGTLHLEGGSSTLGNVLMARNAYSTGTGSVTATMNVKGTANVTMGGSIAKATDNGTQAATAILNLEGGVLNMGGNPIGVLGGLLDQVNLKAGELANVSQINDGAAVSKTGAGTLKLTGASAFSGPMTVADGALLVNGTHSGTGGYTLNATLGGNGTVSSIVEVATNGKLAPGAALESIGLLTVGGLLMTGSNAELAFDIASPGRAGTDYDQLVVTSTVGESLMGNLRINLGGGYVPAGSGYDEFTIISNAGSTLADRSNAFAFDTLNGQALVNNTATIDGRSYTLNYAAGDGNDVTLQIAVPEPGAIGVLAIGLLGTLIRRRRR